jgi:hypothetical protein
LASHRFAAVQPPVRLDRSAIEFHPGLFGNDYLPDCSAAGLANAAGMVAAINGYTLAIDADKVPPFYAACVGCDPTDAAMMATDGAMLLDVLQRQMQTGFDVGEQAPLIGLHGTLPLDRSVLASAMAHLGHVYAGVTLHEQDMDSADVWDLSDGAGDVVGGHCIVLTDYTGLTDTDAVCFATWGRWQSCTWRWLAARLDEAHACVWRQLAAASGADIGVDADALAADLAGMVA